MSYEAMPCVLKNEDGTPMYGLLIKPLQNQVVIQVAQNQQQSQQQILRPASTHQSTSSPAVLAAVSSQVPSTSTWNGYSRSNGSHQSSNGANTPHRRHYPTILPRETPQPSTSKATVGSSWAQSTANHGLHSTFNGTPGNGFAALVQSNSRTPPCINTVKFAYAASAVPTASPLSTPPLLPFLGQNGPQTPAAFTQALSAFGLVPSQSTVEVNGVNSQLDDQQFANVFDQNDVSGIITNSLDANNTGGLLNDCVSNSSTQNNNFGGDGGTTSADLDSLLRDVDLNDIANSLMPLLQECTSGGDDGVNDTFAERNLVSSATLVDVKNPRHPVDGTNLSTPMVTFEVPIQVAQVTPCQQLTATTSRPPCRYQGLLSNTSNLRVGCSSGVNSTPASAMLSVFDTAASVSNPDSSISTCQAMASVGGMEKSQSVAVQPQAVTGDYDHASHEATTPDSGIQSMGDSPHAVPQSSPMQFFSTSPDARRRRISSPPAQTAVRVPNGTANLTTGVPHMEMPQSQHQAQLQPFQPVPSSLEQQLVQDSAPSASWPQSYMQPLCVNTAYFSPISESESSPTVRVPENSTVTHFPVFNAPRCYSPSTTSSDCGNESSSRRNLNGPNTAKRKRRTKKRTSAGVTSATSGGLFEDMPILQPEGVENNDRVSRPPSPMDIASVRPFHQEEEQQPEKSNNEKEQLTLNVADPNALVEKLLSVVPKEQLASLRRILDERLSGSTNNKDSGSSRTPASIGGFSANRSSFRGISALEKGLSRWQSKNAGYASDTSDVSSSAEVGSQGGRKKTTEEEGDSTTSSGLCWRKDGDATQLFGARRPSLSAIGGDMKKEDPLKKLMEYRAKARSNCVKPTVLTRVNELIPALIQLCVKDSMCSGDTTAESLSTAFKKMQDRLAILKDAPVLVRECNENVAEKRKTAFNSLQNLEVEASDDDEDPEDGDDREAPVLQSEATENPPELLPQVRLKELPNRTASSPKTVESESAAQRPLVISRRRSTTKEHQTVGEKEKEAPQDIVEVRENPQRQNISVKIKLSLLRGSPTEAASAKNESRNRSVSRESEKRKSTSGSTSEMDHGPTASGSGKTKRPKTHTALPPKKRFKDGHSAKESRQEDRSSLSRKSEEEANRKRHHGRPHLSSPESPKKKRPHLEPVIVLQPLELVSERDGLLELSSPLAAALESEAMERSTTKKDKVPKEADVGAEKTKHPKTGKGAPEKKVSTKEAVSPRSKEWNKATKDSGAGATSGKLAKDMMLRRCRLCKNWTRVGGSDSAGTEKPVCVECRSINANAKLPLNGADAGAKEKSHGQKSRRTMDLDLETAKKNGKSIDSAISRILDSTAATSYKMSVVQPSDLEKQQKKANGDKSKNLPTTSNSTNRTVKAVSAVSWKFPRKNFVKAGIFRSNDSSSTDNASSDSVVISPAQCRLLGAGADGDDFQLPYDIWWHQRYQKDFMCLNPSRNYRKLRTNTYVDAKPATGFQHHICTCKLPSDPSGRACGDECLNRMTFTECCVSSCPCGDQCTNNRFQRREWAEGLEVFESGTAKGVGVRIKKPIKEGTFVCEYLGEVVSTKTFGERMATWYRDCEHHYALNLDAGLIIDGYRSGSVARLINHSCEPNCEMQKWWVNGQYRVGVFALRDIKPGEELTYNYKFHAFDTPQKCLCGTPSCRGFVDGGGGGHQVRKSRPKRSNVKEGQADMTTNKVHLLKPLSYRERVVVLKRRLFLLRNVDGMRKKLQALTPASAEQPASAEDEKRKADLISYQLAALKTSRIRTRQLAVSENDAQIQKLAGLVQLLKSVLQTLATAIGQDGQALVSQFKNSGRPSKKPSPSTSQSSEKPEAPLDFDKIEHNVEKGLYHTPEAFDRDMKSLFSRLKTSATGEPSIESKQAVEELERLYESGKSSIVDQLKDALGFQLPLDFLSESQPGPSRQEQNESDGSRANNIDQNRRDSDVWTEDLYWGTNAPFVATADTDDTASEALWTRKGDAFDKEDDKVHCVCGICEDDGMMIQCDQCRYWQHSECVGVAAEQVAGEYVCEFCTTGRSLIFKDVIMSPQPEIRLQQCVYYRSLMKNGLQVRIGECVYVKKNIDEKHKQLLRNFNRQCVQASGESETSTSDDTEGIEDAQVDTPETTPAVYRRSDLRVFRVERLFTGPKGVKFVFGSYFARPHETFCEPSRRFYRNEIFVTPLYDTLPLDAVVGRCLVVDVQTYCKGRPRYPTFAEEDIYICEYRLDKGQRLFDKTHARNRYPICTKPYIFEKFAERLKVKRDFTPFTTAKKSDTGQHSKSTSTISKKDDQSRKSKSNVKNDSGLTAGIVDNRRAMVLKKKLRIEQLIDKLKRE